MSLDPGRGPIAPVPKDPPEPEPERRRRKRRRSRDVARNERVREPVAAARPKPSVRRWVLGLVLLGVAGAAAVPIVLWSRYSKAYVISRNATVKGSITNVGAQLDGVVTGVEVDPGQHVVAGQVLARFEDHQLQANVLRARSRLAEATARSASALARINAAQSQTEEARARHAQRVPLAETGVISLDELRGAETRLRTTEALEQTAIADQQAVGAEVAAAEAELALAKADLEAALIRAPADGWVLRRIAEPGGSVVVGQPIIALWIGKEVWVEAWIDEDVLPRVTAGSEATVTVKPFPEREFHGTVESIGASTDFELPEASVPQPRNERMRATPVVPVRVRLDEADGLFPGLSAVVAIRSKAAK